MAWNSGSDPIPCDSYEGILGEFRRGVNFARDSVVLLSQIDEKANRPGTV